MVSSPGVDKPFKFDWQLNKHTGRTLEIELIEGKKIEAKLNDISDKGILSLTKKFKKGKKQETEDIEINFDDIKSSKVKLEF